jgi:hypothetical protein
MWTLKWRTADGRSPSSYFIDYVNDQNEKLTTAITALNNAVDGLVAAQAQSVGQQQQVVVAAQSVAVAQSSADSVAAPTARSGDALSVMALIPAGSGWVAGPQVNLAGVSAGTLSVINSGPTQTGTTDVETPGSYTADWRIVEIVGFVETTKFSGQISCEKFLEDIGPITSVSFLYNLSDTSADIPGQVSTGAVSYRLDISSPDVTLTNVQAYIYARRS